MLRLFLVRHGQSTFNLEHRIQGNLDPPLTEEGEQHADWLTEHFSSDPIEYAYSGSQIRQRDTIGKIAKSRDITLIVDERLNERNWGRYNGRYEHEVNTGGIPLDIYLFLKENPNDDTNPEIPKDSGNPGETIETTQKRVAELYDELVGKYSATAVVTTVLMVSSQFTSAYLLNYIAGNTAGKPCFYHQPHTCINEIRVSPMVTEVVQTNFMGHVHWREAGRKYTL